MTGRVYSIAVALLMLVSVASGFDLDSLLVQAVGGQGAKEKLRTVSAMYGAGPVTLNGMTGRFVLYVAVPDKIRFEMDFGLLQIVQAYDGRVAWLQDQNGMVSLLSGYEKSTLLSQAYFMTYSYLFDDRIPGGRDYLGIETIEEVAYHKVAFFPMYQDTVYSYYETETGRQSFDVIFMDNLTTVTEYLDYRSHDGVMLALASNSTAVEAGITAEMTVDTLAFKAGFDQALFSPPESDVDYRFPPDTDSVIVPFDFIAGHIYIQASVNGRTLTFLLDSGASSNIFHRPALEGLNLPALGQVPLKGIGGYEQVDLVQTDSTVIGGLVLRSQVGAARDLVQLAGNRTGAAPFGGVLGYDVLSRVPVLVDFDDRRLIMFDPEQFEPAPGGHEVPFGLTQQIPTIRAELNGIPGRYLVDLGNSLGVILHDEFSRRHNLRAVLDDVAVMPGAVTGVGGTVGGKTARAAGFAFGDIRITDLPVTLPDSSGGLSGSVELAGNIGNRLLQRYRVLFDYAGQRLVIYDAARPGD